MMTNEDRTQDTIRMATWNVRGMNDEVKEREIVQVLEEAKVDICGLTETKWKGERVREWQYGLGICAGVRENERAREGVCLMVSNKWKSKVREYGTVGSRIVWVRMKVGIQVWAIVCVYAPTEDRVARVKEEFWTSVDACLDKFDRSERVFLIGDMNGKVGNVRVDGVVGQWGVPGGVDGNGSALLDICAGKRLAIANTLFRHKMIHRYTWRVLRRVEGVLEERKAMIDYVCVDERLRRQVCDTRVWRGWGNGISDHHIVMAKVRIQNEWVRRQRQRQEGAPVKRVEKLQESEKMEEYKNRVEERLGRYELEQMEGVERVCKIFTEELCEVCEMVCGVRRRGGGVQGTAWWNDEVKQAVEQKKKAYSEWQANIGREVEREKREVYVSKRREVKRLVKESKKRVDEEFGRNLGEKWRENKKLFWKEVKKVRQCERGNSKGVKDGRGRLLVEKRARIRRWKEHFEDLLNVESESSASINGWGMAGRRRDVRREDGISRVEVVEAMKKIKTGKAPGIDGVCGEMLKYGGDSIVEWIWKLCKLAWEEGRVPEDWKSGIIVPLYKGKGERDVCGNHRGICLLSVIGKIYGRILIDRVRYITEELVGEEQGGFRRGRGCVDQMFALRCIVEKYLEKGKKVYAAFMDLEKAYDRVDRQGMWRVLRIYGVDGILLRAVKSMYEGARAAVRVDGELSEFFDLNVGLKQGCVMSPWLFNLYMDGVIREVKGRAVDVGVSLVRDGMEWKIPVLLFADDTVLLSEDEWELQGLVNEFGTVCKKRNLAVNTNKSKVVVFERGEATECTVRLDGVDMENVKVFKYLGSVMSKDGSLGEEVLGRVQQGRRVVGSLKAVMRNREVSMEVKKSLCDSIVVPTLTYGSETWTLLEGNKSRVRAVEMSYLRGACGVSWRNRMTNEEVKELCGVDTDVIEKVERNTLRWFGHVERMESDRLTKRVYESGVEGGRVRGRPRVRWRDGVAGYLRERGVSWEEGRQMTGDRMMWRRFVSGHPLRD